MASDNLRVLIPFGDFILALDSEAFEKAVQLGREFASQHNGKPAQEPEKILTAEEAAELTKIPASWFYEQARQGNLPFLEFGKYRRFLLSAVLKSVEVRRR